MIFMKKLADAHCSALIKVIKDEDENIKDILIGHTTWDDYSEMLRIYKTYNFELFNNEELRAITMTFSSYPGTISSTDDFYQINNELVVMETTIEILNENMYSYVAKEDKYIPDYMRVVISNRLARNAPEWTRWLKYVNTGTYNS